MLGRPLAEGQVVHDAQDLAALRDVVLQVLLSVGAFVGQLGETQALWGVGRERERERQGRRRRGEWEEEGGKGREGSGWVVSGERWCKGKRRRRE